MQAILVGCGSGKVFQLESSGNKARLIVGCAHVFADNTALSVSSTVLDCKSRSCASAQLFCVLPAAGYEKWAHAGRFFASGAEHERETWREREGGTGCLTVPTQWDRVCRCREHF